MRSKPRAPDELQPNASGEFPWGKAPKDHGEDEADFGESADDEYVSASSSEWEEGDDPYAQAGKHSQFGKRDFIGEGEQTMLAGGLFTLSVGVGRRSAAGAQVSVRLSQHQHRRTPKHSSRHEGSACCWAAAPASFY